MELRVEAAEGSILPPGSYIAVKLGESLKQGRYEPKRAYQFPGMDRRRHAKIDVFTHVGSSEVPVNPEAGPQVREVSIPSKDPAVDNLALKVSMNPAAIAATGDTYSSEKVSMRKQAQEYLDHHHIEELLASGVKSLLQTKPNDPIEFLCNHLRASQTEFATHEQPPTKSKSAQEPTTKQQSAAPHEEPTTNQQSAVPHQDAGTQEPASSRPLVVNSILMRGAQYNSCGIMPGIMTI